MLVTVTASHSQQLPPLPPLLSHFPTNPFLLPGLPAILYCESEFTDLSKRQELVHVLESQCQNSDPTHHPLDNLTPPMILGA